MERETTKEEYILQRLKEVSDKLERVVTQGFSWYTIEFDESKVIVVKELPGGYKKIIEGERKGTVEDLANKTEQEIFDFLIDELKEFVDWEDDKTTRDWHTESLGGYGEFTTTYFIFKIKPELIEIFKKLKERIERETAFYVGVDGETLYTTVLTIRYKKLDYAEVLTRLKNIESWL